MGYRMRLKTLFEAHQDWDPDKSLGSQSKFKNHNSAVAPDALKISIKGNRYLDRHSVTRAKKLFEKYYGINLDMWFRNEGEVHKGASLVISYVYRDSDDFDNVVEWFDVMGRDGYVEYEDEDFIINLYDNIYYGEPPGPAGRD
jgi:hypothetical protein